MKHALQLPRKNQVAMATGCTWHHDGEAMAAQSGGDASRQHIEKLSGDGGRVCFVDLGLTTWVCSGITWTPIVTGSDTNVGNCGLCGLPSIPLPQSYPWCRSQCIMRLEGRDLFIDYTSKCYKYSTRVPENPWLLNHITNHYHTCQFSESNIYISP
jgi:hypothetical protein